MATVSGDTAMLVSPEDREPTSAWQEWKGGWRIVVAGITGMMLASLHVYSLGVMVVPLEEEFGWTRAEITSGLMLCAIVSVIFAPFFGMLVDRFGPRRIAIFGMALYCSVLGILSTAGASIATWWLLWTLMAAAVLSTKPTVWIAAVSGIFNRSRGLALAIVLSATGISQAVTPLVAYALVETLGWRGAYVAMAVGAAVIALPILWFWFSSAQDRARVSKPTTGKQAATNLPGVSAREGFRSGAFVRLGFAALAMGAAGGALAINLIPILSASGLDRGVAVSLAGISGVSAILGRILGGVLLDRFNARVVGGIAVLLPVVTCAILLGAPGNVILAVFGVFLSGLAAGAELDAIAYLAGRSFGLCNFGLLFGTLMGILSLGIGMGPTLANLFYDRTGSYELALWAIIPLSMITSFMFFTVGPYPTFREVGEQGEATGKGN